MAEPPAPLLPGATIGILGGGQLGRMIALAAAAMGYRCHAFCQHEDDPAAQVSAAVTVAPFDDDGALGAFAATVDVATLEFENLPIAAVERIARSVPVHPGAAVLAVAQDRLREKRFASAIGVGTAPFAAVPDAAALPAAIAQIGAPAILKTCRLGYDGKGQVKVDAGSDLAAAWAESGAGPTTGGAILEGFVAFEREISVIVARGVDGATAAYVPVENRHADHILSETIAPAPIATDIANAGLGIATRLAVALEVVGLLAVEMFVTPNGAVLMNEMAPRPHNSGHWTIDACATSQFAQLVRAVCGLPLGDPARHADARMLNLLGDTTANWPGWLADPAAHLHLYGKDAARPGRKMGHVTWLLPKAQG
jgi:5-(carboxyamino)imidazole ribonucleotide synthase